MQNPAVAVDISSFSTKLQKLLDKANILAEFVGVTIPAAKAVQLVAAINLWMARMFPVAVILGVVIAIVNIFRIVRVTAPQAHIPGKKAAMA